MAYCQGQNKREILKEKVVSLVRDFGNTEGGITLYDLLSLFGSPNISECTEVADALAKQEIILK